MKNDKDRIGKNPDGKNDDELRVLSADDEKIKIVGEVLANDSSRAIMRLLAGGEEMTINQIAQETDLSIPLVSHHLKKMQDTGVVKVSRVGKSVKGQEMKYYCATNRSFLITPPERQTHSIFHSLRKFSKFAAIAMAGLVSWTMLRPAQEPQTMPIGDDFIQSDFSNTAELQDEDKWSSASKTEPEITEPTSAPTPESEPEPSHTEGFDLQIDSERANTGSVSLDRTVYPEPYGSTGGESFEPLLSIIIPIVVIVGGIIIERILSRWYSKRKMKNSV